MKWKYVLGSMILVAIISALYIYQHQSSEKNEAEVEPKPELENPSPETSNGIESAAEKKEDEYEEPTDPSITYEELLNADTGCNTWSYHIPKNSLSGEQKHTLKIVFVTIMKKISNNITVGASAKEHEESKTILESPEASALLGPEILDAIKKIETNDSVVSGPWLPPSLKRKFSIKTIIDPPTETEACY